MCVLIHTRVCLLGVGWGGCAHQRHPDRGKGGNEIRRTEGSDLASIAKPSPNVLKSHSKAKSLNQLQRNQSQVELTSGSLSC